MTQNDSLFRASMPQMSQNDSHFEVFSFEMSQNDSFPGLKCPKEPPLSVDDEPPATPPSPQNDTLGGVPSAAGHPANPKPQSAHQVWHDRPPNDAPLPRRACPQPDQTRGPKCRKLQGTALSPRLRAGSLDATASNSTACHSPCGVQFHCRVPTRVKATLAVGKGGPIIWNGELSA